MLIDMKTYEFKTIKINKDHECNFVTNTVTDKLSRNFEYLRISVTDRCNFRCSYCMPSDIFNKDYSYISQDNILSYEEIIDICKLLKK